MGVSFIRHWGEEWTGLLDLTAVLPRQRNDSGYRTGRGLETVLGAYRRRPGSPWLMGSLLRFVEQVRDSFRGLLRDGTPGLLGVPNLGNSSVFLRPILGYDLDEDRSPRLELEVPLRFRQHGAEAGLGTVAPLAATLGYSVRF